MLHTFVILAYGRSEHLEECIKSLLCQNVKSDIKIATGTPSEFLDGVSKKYGIELIVNTERSNIADDWNFAINSAKTKYVTLAHQDDVYLPEYSDKCISKAEQKNDTLIVFTNYSENRKGVISDSGLKLLIKKFLLFPFLLNKHGYKSKFIKKFVLSFGCPVCCPTVFLNIDNLSGFKFDREYRINLDWNAWIRMAKTEGRFIYDKNLSLIHRIHSDSETSKNLLLRKEEDRKIFRELWFYPMSEVISFFYKFSYSSFSK